MLLVFASSAQTKKPVKTNKPATADSAITKVTSPADTTDPTEQDILVNRKFAAYTRKARKPDLKVKLCINVVSGEKAHVICMNDSLCKNPETTKVLFEKTQGDTTYFLVLVDAFSKVNDRPSCDGTKETKLVFIKWNVAKDKISWRQRTVSSCLRAITNMTKEPISSWDGTSPLIVNYHKGGVNFIELKFDPANYQLGLQSPQDNSGN